MLENIDAEKLISFLGLVTVLIWDNIEKRKELKKEREEKNEYIRKYLDLGDKVLQFINNQAT